MSSVNNFDQSSKLGIEIAVLRDIYHFTIGGESTGSNQKEVEVTKHFVNFILESNDTDLLWDLQKFCGRPQTQHLIPFGKSYRNIDQSQQWMKEDVLTFHIYES